MPHRHDSPVNAHDAATTSSTTSTTTQGLQHAQLPIEWLYPHPRNYKRHPEGQLERLATSLRRFGQVRSIVVQEGGPARFIIVAGHGLVEAARREGFSLLAADIIPATWTDRQIEGYLVADNRLGELGDDDLAALAALLQEQADAGESLESLGASSEELSDLLETLAQQQLAAGAKREIDDAGGGGDDFDAEPESGPTRSRPGDLWALGAHRLVCGSSLDEANVRRLLADPDGGLEVIECVWTDPPYGVAYVGKTKDALTIQNDTMDTPALTDFLRAAFGAANACCIEGAPWYVASPAGPQMLAFATVLSELGVWRQSLTWVKQTLVLGHSDFHYRHEQIFYGWTPGGAHTYYGDRKQDTVWAFDRPTASREHPTMKPLALIAHALDLSTQPGDVVFDGFGGSGSTLIAAHRLGRRARLVELDPHYCDVILRRYEEETGETATLLEREVSAEEAEEREQEAEEAAS